MRYLLLVILFISSQVEAKTYSICADNYEKAKLELASMINSSISRVQSKDVISHRSNDSEDVFSSIAQSSRVESHLDLVDIQLSIRGDQKCAQVDSEQQENHTRSLLQQTKTFTVNNLPEDKNKKVAMLDEWLRTITATQQMINVFGQNYPAKESSELSSRYKKLSDLHTETVLAIENLVFKGCGDSKQEALQTLNQEIFTTRKEEDKGFLDALTSVFKDEKELPVSLFSAYIEHRDHENNQCAYLVKAKLLNIALNMKNKINTFNPNSLPEDPKQSYKTLENWISHVDITHSLMTVFDSDFTLAQLNNTQALKNTLEKKFNKLIPQSITFHASGATNVKITLNGKKITLNQKSYVPEGVYNYVLSSPGFCDAKDSITIDKLEDEVIDIDFDGYEYPTVLFISDNNFTAMVDGIPVKPNVRTKIKRCDIKVPYLVKSATQSYKDSIYLRAGGSITKEFSFLNKQELAIFSNAKTKQFTVRNDEKISDSLTSYSSKKLIFKIENQPSSGNLNLDDSGHFVYTPEAGYVGKVNFEYRIENDGDESPIKVALITVTGKGKQLVAPAVSTAKKQQNQTEEENTEAKKVKLAESEENVDQAKLEAFLFQKLEEKDIETLKAAQARFPKAFEIWMNKARK